MGTIYSQCQEVFIWIGESLSQGIRSEPVPENFHNLDTNSYEARGNLQAMRDKTRKHLSSDRAIVSGGKEITRRSRSGAGSIDALFIRSSISPWVRADESVKNSLDIYMSMSEQVFLNAK